MKIARESIWIAIIGLADLITTVLWVRYHGAHEANPVFAHYLQMGLAWFALMKLVLLAGPIFVLEWARRKNPRFTLRAARFAIGAYCGLYIVGFLHLNPNAVRPQSAMAELPPAKLQARTRPHVPTGDAIGTKARHRPHMPDAPLVASI